MILTRFLAASVTAVALMAPAASLDTASADFAAAARQHRDITAKIVNVTPQRLQIRAHVPHYPTRWTFLQKKLCGTCHWKIVARKQTTKYGRVFYPVGAPATGRWYFRVGTPETKRYATSYSPTFYTYTR